MVIKHILRSLFTVALLLCACNTTFGLETTLPSSVSSINIQIYLPDGTTYAEQVLVELWDPLNPGYPLIDSNGDEHSALSDTSGLVTFFDSNNFLLGSYTLVIIPADSPDLVDNGLYKNLVFPFTISLFDTTISLNGNLVQANRHFKIEVVDQSGTPIQNAEIGAWREGPPGPGAFGLTRTNSSGIAYVALKNTDNWPWGFHISSNGSVPKFLNEQYSAPGPGFSQIDVSLVTADSYIQVDLIDANQQGSPPPPFSLPSTVYGSIACDDLNQFNTKFEVPLDPFDSTKTFPIIAGSYRCTAFIDGYATTEVEVTVTAGTTAVINIDVFTKNANVFMRAVDEKGNLINDVGIEFSIRTERPFDPDDEELSPPDSHPFIADEDWVTTTDGTATLRGIGGQDYGAMVFLAEDAQGQTPTSYIVPFDVINLLANASEDVTITFQLTSTNSTITVTLTDQLGNALEGWAAADSFAEDSAAEDVFAGAPIINGLAVIPVIAGRTYQVGAFPDFNENDFQIPPKSVEVTLAEGENRAIAFQTLTPNHTINITPNLAATIDFMFCFGHNSAGQESWIAVPSGGNAALRVVVDSKRTPWKVGCHAVAGNSGAEKFYQGFTTYQPKAGESGNVSIDLVDEGTYYPEETYNFNQDQTASFTLPDGESTIDIPANAFGSGSDSCIMTVASATGYTSNDEWKPILPWEFTFTCNGESITETSQPVTIAIQIDLSDLNELGATLDDIIGASFNEDTHQWLIDAAVSVDQDTGVVSLSVTHFSIWGTLINLAKALQAQIPSKLKAKVVKTKKKGSSAKKKKVKFSWKLQTEEGTDVGSDVQAFTVEYIKVSSGKKKKKKKKKKKNNEKDPWAKAKEINGVVGKEATKKFKPGKYKYRVKIPGGEYSSPKKFTVK